MATLTASAAKGLQIIQGTLGPLYTTHDNASDNMVSGAYSHNPLEGSATEFDLVVSLLLYLQNYVGQAPQRVVSGQTLDVQVNSSLVVAGFFQCDGVLQVDGTMAIVG